MSIKRANENALSSLVPVNKKTKSEIATYAAKSQKEETRSSSLFSPIVQLNGQEGEIFCCKFSPCGNILASAGFDRKIYLWNVYGECENWANLAGHNGSISELKFNSDGSEIVTSSTDKSAFLWDVTTCERIRRFKGHTDFVNGVDVSLKVSHLICTGGDDASVKVLSVSFNEPADQIISSGIDNDLKVWDIRKNGLLYTMKGHTDSPTGLRLSPDGNYLASNSMDNTIRVWDIRPFTLEERCVKVMRGHSHNFEKNLLRVSWSPDGELISGGSADKFLYVWEVECGKIAYKLPGHTGSINDVDFHPNEPIVASGSSDKKIYLGEL